MKSVSQFLLFMFVLVATVCVSSADPADDGLHRFCQGIENGRFVANPRSCQHWLFCSNDRATEGNCPGIFYFDESFQMCRYPSYVECAFDAVDVTCPVDGFELVPHPSNCDQYVACIDGFPRVINCAPGLHWDRKSEVCDVPANAQCTVPDQDLNYYCDPARTYVTRHPFDCQQFLLCVAGELRQNRCAESLLFDPVKLRCDFAHNVDCSLPEEEVDYTCDPNRAFYFTPHPTNCQYFIMCVGGNRQIERCAEGLHFDWIDLQCDIADRAICLAPPS